MHVMFSLQIVDINRAANSSESRDISDPISITIIKVVVVCR